MKTSRLVVVSIACLAAISLAAATPPGWYGFGFNRHVDPGAARQWFYIHRVEPDGPAHRAGLRVQDVVIAINGSPLGFKTDRAALQFFASRKAGDVLRLTVLRGSMKLTVTVRAAPMPPQRASQWRANDELARAREPKP
ncbi:MAG TPA: PDZ domain-containing protein [Thermoanaerobaculia bacterium]